MKGFGLIDVGSIKNILLDFEYPEFKDKYPSFRGRIMAYAYDTPEITENLMNCLSFLETDYRFAL